MKAKKSDEFWAKVIADVRREGGTRREVAAKHGVSMAALKYQLGKLPIPKGQNRQENQAFLPVRVRGERLRRIDVEVGRIHLHFEEGCDPKYVAALLSLLSGC